MIETQLLVNADIGFDTCEEVLDHISELLTKEGYVKESYHAAIHERESVFPTGIDLGFGAVAIPHCDATHANKPCVYLIKPNKPVPFARADDDGELEAELIIALVVTDPAEQMQLLRALFTSLQNEEFFNELKGAITIDGLAETFSNTILKSNEE